MIPAAVGTRSRTSTPIFSYLQPPPLLPPAFPAIAIRITPAGPSLAENPPTPPPLHLPAARRVTPLAPVLHARHILSYIGRFAVQDH